MFSALMIPFLIQGGLMFVDEFYFHRKRGLGLWERIGHPLDTFSVLICYWFLLTHSWTTENLWKFILLAAFSCVLITKDEFIHTEECEARENWIHSVLFILHPICFLCAALLWRIPGGTAFLFYQALAVAGFMIYQSLYWSVLWKKSKI